MNSVLHLQVSCLILTINTIIKLLAQLRHVDAESEHSVVSQLAPDNAEAWMRLGSCRFQLEQFSAAIPPLRRASQLLAPAAAPAMGTHLEDTLWLLVQVCHLCSHL